MLKGMVRYGSGRDRALEAKYEPRYRFNNNNNLNKSGKMKVVLIASAVVLGAIVVLNNLNREINETYDEASRAFDNIYD